MTAFTLDDIRAAAEAKYGATEIDLGDALIVRLLNPLRLPKTKRDKLQGLQDSLNGDDVDQEQVLRDLIETTAETKAQAKALLIACGDDLAMLVSVFEKYAKGTQAGEA